MGRPAKKTVEQVNDELAGITATECPVHCKPGHCVISGMSVCAHPNKGGGGQPAVNGDPAAMERFRSARKLLAVQAANKRG